MELAAGDWVKIAPAAKRQFFAADDSAISFACIQVKANSLEGYTADDAVIAAQYVPPAKCTHAGITPEYTSGVRKIHIRTGNIAFRMVSLYE